MAAASTLNKPNHTWPGRTEWDRAQRSVASGPGVVQTQASALASSTGPEKRIDPADGNAYTQVEFVRGDEIVVLLLRRYLPFGYA